MAVNGAVQLPFFELPCRIVPWGNAGTVSLEIQERLWSYTTLIDHDTSGRWTSGRFSDSSCEMLSSVPAFCHWLV